MNQAEPCWAKLEDDSWSHWFFFSVLVQYFWYLASHLDSQCILSKFCSLERGDRAKAKALCPSMNAPLAVHTHMHTFPQNAVCEIVFKNKVYFKCLKKYQCNLLLVPLGLYSQKVAGNISGWLLYSGCWFLLYMKDSHSHTENGIIT